MTVYVTTRTTSSEDAYIPKDESFDAFISTCGDESEKITEQLQGRLHLVDFASGDRVSATIKTMPKPKEECTSEPHHVNLSLLACGKFYFIFFDPIIVLMGQFSQGRYLRVSH